MRLKSYLCLQTAAIALLAGSHARAADDQAASDALPEIVVTATKRSTSLESTPIAITALTPKVLDDNHVQTIQDVTHLVPSFQATSEGDHGVITLTMRGIGNDSAKTEYADPEVALFVDGIYTPRAEGATALLFDMDSIEVLRGPQGTLWGRNSTVGAVNMQTAKPTFDSVYGSAEGGVGSYSRVGARAMLNVPINDKVAVRFAYASEQHDGYTDYQTPVLPSVASQQAAALAAGIPAAQFKPINANLFTTNGPKYNSQDQTAARLSALFRPYDNFTWDVSFEYYRDRGTPDMNLMQQPRAGENFWSALIDTAPYLERDVYSLRSRMDYDINDYLAVTYTAGYSWFSGQSDFDQDGGARVPTSFTSGATYQEDRTNSSHYYNYSHELELKSSGSHEIDWQLGLYYAAENNDIRFDIPILNGTQEGSVNWQGSFIQPKETVESKAIFGQSTWNVTDQLHLTGGLRFTDDIRTNEGGTNNGWTGAITALGVPIAASQNPLLPGSGFSTYQFNDGRYHGHKLTYLTRAGFDVTKDFLVYASISSGYKSGGLQDGGVHYGPESITNYEVGTKNKLFDGTVTWNNAAFYEDFKDFQFSAPVTNPNGSHSLATSNAEGATVYGVESELAAKFTKEDLVQLSVSLLSTDLGHLIAGSNDYSLPVCAVPGISNCLNVTGHELPHAPTAAATLMYEHKFELPNDAKLIPQISTHIESSSWLSVFNLGPGDRQGAYTRTSLNMSYVPSDKPWSVQLFAQNLEDGHVKTNAQNSFGAWQSQYLPPLTFGANVRVDF